MDTPPLPSGTPGPDLVAAATAASERRSPYLIPSRIAFVDFDSGPNAGRVPFRSVLEARWAIAFDRLHLGWSYEPAVFALPGGGRYTPDFYLDDIGWVEIKPSWEAVLDVRRKLARFAQQRAAVVPEDRARRFFTFAIGHPAFVHLATEPAPIVEWLEDGVEVLSWEDRYRTFATETGRELFEEIPAGYADHVNRTLREAERARIEGPATPAECLFVDAVELGGDFRRMKEGGVREALSYLRSVAATRLHDNDEAGALRLNRSAEWYADVLRVALD